MLSSIDSSKASLAIVPGDVLGLIVCLLPLKDSLKSNFIAQFFNKRNRTVEFEQRFEEFTFIDYTFLKKIQKQYTPEAWLELLKSKQDTPIFSLLLKVSVTIDYCLWVAPSQYPAITDEVVSKYHEASFNFCAAKRTIKGASNQSGSLICNHLRLITNSTWANHETNRKLLTKIDKQVYPTFFQWKLIEAPNSWFIQLFVGRTYQKGKRVNKDLAAGFQWIKLAAENNCPHAYHDLAYAYCFGIGTEKNYERALHWWQKGADIGSSTAMLHLGFMYEKGWGVAKDQEEAERRFGLAAAEDNPWAQYALGNLNVRRGNVTEAIRFYRSAVEQDHCYSKLALGIHLPDEAEAERLFRKGVEAMKIKDYQFFLNNPGYAIIIDKMNALGINRFSS